MYDFWDQRLTLNEKCTDANALWIQGNGLKTFSPHNVYAIRQLLFGMEISKNRKKKMEHSRTVHI